VTTVYHCYLFFSLNHLVCTCVLLVLLFLLYRSYNLETPSWSCEWDADNGNIVYCGQNNSILMFDIRMTNRFLHKFPALHHSPIHTLIQTSRSSPTHNNNSDLSSSPLSPSPTSTCLNKLISSNKFGGKGLLSASCAGICYWDISSGSNLVRSKAEQHTGNNNNSDSAPPFCTQLPMEGNNNKL
jgi:hypothetical protein